MNKKNIASSSPMLQNMKHFTRAGEQISILTEREMTQKKKERLRSWITYYRNNMAVFIEHYLGIQLFPYQRYWINLIAKSTDFLGIASRASAKSWLIGVYVMARCILYPGTIVALSSSTKGQAGLIISSKCVMLRDEHPNLAREISNITTNQNKWQVDFHNGSKINVVISGEGGRGHRSTINVLEERRLIPNEIIDSILRPFLESRQAPYLKKKEYFSMREEPQEIIITSAYYKSHEWWGDVKKSLNAIVDGDKDTKAIFFDYLISLKHGIKTRKQMIKDKNKMDSITFLMEYGNIPYGSSSTSFYKLGLFERSVKRSWRPIRDDVYITTKKNNYDIPKLSDEMRVVSVDVAARAGSSNDNTVITCARLLPSKKGWMTEIVYVESHNGKNTTLQSLRIKQIFEEFLGDILVLDVMGVGIGVYDALTSVTKDEIRGIEYPAYTSISDYLDQKTYEDLSNRTISKDAKECIFPIQASAQLNSQIAVAFRDRLKRKLIKFLVDDSKEEEFLIKAGNKDILDQEDNTIRAYLLQAHIQTSLMINECIALEMIPSAGYIKLEEPQGARKDRYSSVSYLNYYVSLLDTQLLKEERSNSYEDDFFNIAMVL